MTTDTSTALTRQSSSKISPVRFSHLFHPAILWLYACTPLFLCQKNLRVRQSKIRSYFPLFDGSSGRIFLTYFFNFFFSFALIFWTVFSRMCNVYFLHFFIFICRIVVFVIPFFATQICSRTILKVWQWAKKISRKLAQKDLEATLQICKKSKNKKLRKITKKTKLFQIEFYGGKCLKSVMNSNWIMRMNQITPCDTYEVPLPLHWSMFERVTLLPLESLLNLNFVLFLVFLFCYFLGFLEVTWMTSNIVVECTL